MRRNEWSPCPECAPVLELLRADRLYPQACSQVGTGWEQRKTLNLCDVPAVPAVPTDNRPTRGPSVVDVLERAAFLEFCEGLDRETADRLALAEHGFPSWEGLASVLARLELDTGLNGGAHHGE